MSDREYQPETDGRKTAFETSTASTEKVEKLLLPGLWESTLIFIVVIAVLYATTGDLRLNELDLHPFWIPVILVSAHYGTYTGLAAVVMAVLLNFALDWPLQGVQEEYFAYLGRLWAEPILWVSASLVLGELRMQHLSELHALGESSREAEIQRHTIGAFCDTLQVENRRLEHQLAVGARHFMREHLQQLARFEASGLHELECKAAEFLRDVFPKAVLSLWKVNKSTLDIPNLTDERHASLYNLLIIQQKQLNTLNESDAELLDGLARLAVPVPSLDGEPICVLAVSELEALSLDSEAPIYLSLLARQAGRALAMGGGFGHRAQPLKSSPAISSYRNWLQDEEQEAS